MHLVVVQHGLWGTPGNTAYLSMMLRDQLTDYIVLNSGVNAGNLTYDGIDVCGDRLHALILATIEDHAASGQPVRAISMVGYSMGGLITRYVAGKLYAEGRLDAITPVNFITVATPHLGAWRMPSTWYNRAFNYLVPVVTSRSGHQLVLQDKHLWGKPLLCLLSHPDLLFMRALRRFKKLMLLANVFHDRPVPYCTASIRLDNPYERSPPVAVDPRYPSIVRPASAAAASAAAAPASLPRSAVKAPAADGCGNGGASAGGAAGAGTTAVTVVTASAVDSTGANTTNDVSLPAGAGCGCEAAPGAESNSTQRQQQQPGCGDPPKQQEAPSAQQQPRHQQQQQPRPQQPQDRQHQRRRLRSTYLPVIMTLCLPLALPVLLLMVATGRAHHCKIMRTAMDFSWIQAHHRDDAGGRGSIRRRKDSPAAADGGTVAGEGEGCPEAAEEVRLLMPGGDGPVGADGNGDDGPGAGRPRPLCDIECPSAPNLTAMAAAPASTTATTAAAVAAITTAAAAGILGPQRTPRAPASCIGGSGDAGRSSGGGTTTAAAAAAAVVVDAADATGAGGGGVASALEALQGDVGAGADAAEDDGEEGEEGGDEVVEISEQRVLLHDGIVEVPAEVHRVQEWLAEKLNQLPWAKVDVDCRDLHAHAAIVMRNPARFRHCKDVVQYLCDHFLRE